MKRNYLRVGDRSSSGGTVVESIPSTSCHGRNLTYVGAKVVCPACKQVGMIVAQGPRWPGTRMGYEAALEGDKVSCGCRPQPTMIASQSTMYESFDAGQLAKLGFTVSGAPIPSAPGTSKSSAGFCLACMTAAAERAGSMIVRG